MIRAAAIFLLLLTLWPPSARAQEVDDPATLIGEMTHAESMAQARVLRQHLAETIAKTRADRDAALKRSQDLAAYGVACGDQPGCFLPVPTK